jgi:acetyltransferase-like isoleucine patch superfamily enzyme
MLAPNVAIFDSDHNFTSTDLAFRSQGYKIQPNSIGENVWLGINVVITKGTEIGDNVVVGANSVVRGKLAANAVYAGSPAVLVKHIGSSVSV